jgi:hypothetical protein
LATHRPIAEFIDDCMAALNWEAGSFGRFANILTAPPLLCKRRRNAPREIRYFIKPRAPGRRSDRAGRDVATIRHESARLFELKRALRTSSVSSIAEVQGDALASVRSCDRV